MTVKKEYLGEWWISSDPENKVSGVLTITDDDFDLKLIGSFKQLKQAFSSISVTSERIDLILGYSTCGKNISLLNCSSKGFQMSFPGTITESFSPREIIVGNHYSDLEEIKFKSINISYDYLEYWLNMRLFSEEIEFEKGNKNRTNSISVKYNLAESMEYKYVNSKLSFHSGAALSGDRIKDRSIVQNSYLTFTSLNNYSLEEVYQIIGEFKSLLTIACAKEVSEKNLEGLDLYDKKIKLLYRPFNDQNCKKSIQLRKLLFSFQDIEDFNTFLKNWKVKYELLEPVIHYFVDAHTEGVHSQISFLKITQALEAFSRRTVKKWEREKQESEVRINKVLKMINNQDDKEWLSDILINVSEPSQVNRFKNLLQRTRFLSSFNSKIINSMAYKITQTRNYYTHFNEGLRSKILSFHDMFYIEIYLIYVLHCLILLELGFSEEFIKNNIDSGNKLSFAVKEIKEII
ncbi:hypothetical protein PM10SUCC1_36300 [Propionigenium maris DSM 9537]|uniref:ApeA N-terminal domain-containing protein n=1 Tax=Propionigenium maris DSM 9537 TaxID=1123000 RepID=A0A9W6GQ83_9FUSO|nr:HEPN domain-containing protein [Propionigenium maris]GLI58116.1 hypothetical protein PM10SUCC1_36300 [Propionigenium maris DSM 9537]